MSEENKESIENILDEGARINEQFLFYAHEGLLKFGGSFSTTLGRLLGCADSDNKKKIQIMWIHELVEHASLFVMWAKKNRPDLLYPGYEMYFSKRKVSDEI